MNSLSEVNTKFTLDLLQQLRTSEGNIFFSSVSVTAALSMLLLGTRGNTAREIERVLHVGDATERTKERATSHPVKKSEDVHQQLQKLLTELNQHTDAYELKIANKIFGEKSFRFLPEYLDGIKKFYLTSLESLDFVNAAEESRKKINSWVESQTNEKIKELFPPDTIDGTTCLVLVNAVYFKGLWDQKFSKDGTAEGKFWLNKDTSKSVQMMQQVNNFKFALLKDVQAKVLEMPYKGKDLSMTVLLPNEADGLQKLEDKLTAEKLIEWTSPKNMQETKLVVRLPRFKVEKSYDLKDTLQKMGVVAAFSSQKADLSGISDNRGLAVSKVLHKSFVEVTEEGTEAAASTGIDVGFTSAPVRENFFCDHPFLFFIKENKANNILFIGRVSSP